MIKADKNLGKVVTCFVAICLSGTLMVLSANAAPGIPQGYDSGGEKIFKRFDRTPLAVMTGTDGKRTLKKYYELRQYSGSPPRIPHDVPTSFSGDALKCLSCHERGGYDPNQDAYAPVTPHPEYENCFQCHVPQRTKKLFVETEWKSIKPPKLGLSEMGGSPPPIPHSLQFREDCIACHAGPAAVAEIRVEHASRGNCRQCHVPMISTEIRKEFTRTK